MDAWLWTPLTQHASRVFNRIRYIVDSPGVNPESEPELATATVETTGGRGATFLASNTPSLTPNPTESFLQLTAYSPDCFHQLFDSFFFIFRPSVFFASFSSLIFSLPRRRQQAAKGSIFGSAVRPTVRCSSGNTCLACRASVNRRTGVLYARKFAGKCPKLG